MSGAELRDKRDEGGLLLDSGDSAPAIRRSPVAIALVLLAGLAATFLIPYLVPVEPTVSVSYLVGFNNHAALLIFLLFAAGFAWWTDGFGLSSPEPQPEDASLTHPSTYLLCLTLAFFLFFTAGAWAFMRPHPAFGEAIYFLDRLQHLGAGELPYAQFEFAYGPMLLYLPLAASRLLHSSLADGYYVAWIVEYLFGTLLIYGCVALLPAVSARKNIIFLLLAASWWAGPLSFGENYTPFRFFLAPFFCLLVFPRLSTPLSVARTSVELLAAEVALLLVSPEQAIAFAGATILFLLLSYSHLRSSRQLRIVLLFAGGCALLFWVSDRVGLLLTLHSMSHGGYNFPLLPVMQHIPVFGLLLVAGCVLVNTFRFRRSFGPVEYLILFGLFSLPAAFGRSDIGHLMLNSTGTFLAALAVLSRYPRLWRYQTWSFVALVLLLPAPRIVLIAERSWRANADAVLLLPEANSAAVSTLSRAGNSLVDRNGAPFAPLGYPLANTANLPSLIADTGYYHGIDLVTVSSQVEQKIQELRASPDRDLLLPNNFSCSIAIHRRELSRALSTPYVPPARTGNEILEPLCRYIRLHYEPAPDGFRLHGYAIWAPRR